MSASVPTRCSGPTSPPRPGRRRPGTAAHTGTSPQSRIEHERTPMNTLAIRLTLEIPFYEQMIVGGWNLLAPRSFYDIFPRVDLNPPFSDHLAHDFGGATLCIALLLGIALVKPKTHHVVPAALAFSIWQVPHFFYHLFNTEPPTVAQTIILNAANAFVAVLGLVPILLAVLRDRRQAPATRGVPVG